MARCGLIGLINLSNKTKALLKNFLPSFIFTTIFNIPRDTKLPYKIKIHHSKLSSFSFLIGVDKQWSKVLNGDGYIKVNWVSFEINQKGEFILSVGMETYNKKGVPQSAPSVLDL
jgi:hypothetical protein